MREVALNSKSPALVYLLSIPIAITGGMLLVLQAKSLFFFMGSFILLLMLIYLLDNPVKGIILFLSTKCIFDMFWFIKLPVAELFEINVQRVIGVLFPLVILGIFFVKEKNFFRTLNTTLGKIILLYTAFNVLAIFLATSTSTALVQFSKIIGSYILFFVFGAAAFTERDLRKLIHYFLIFLWIPLGIAFLENFGLVPFTSFTPTGAWIPSLPEKVYAYRLVGLYSHPFDVVRYLVVAFPLTLWMLSTERNPGRKLFYNINLVFLSLAMWRCFYRTGWVILALQLVFWLKMRKRHKTMLAVILICVCVVLMNINFFGDFYKSLLVLLHPSEPEIMSAFSGRFVIWNIHLAKFAQSSTIERLFGHGLGCDREIYFELSDIIGGDADNRSSAHNDFVRALSETGVLGLGTYLLLLILLGKSLWSRIKQTQNLSLRRFGQAVFLIFLGFLLLSNVAGPAKNPSIAWYLWGFSGLVILGKGFKQGTTQNKGEKE
ncbi:MAG: O-antigen ligase family protein [candidate division Zixibacteria bacterium]|nr:O-antigen ligase family protein [candidate division Zixibacteria bacterium]